MDISTKFQNVVNIIFFRKANGNLHYFINGLDQGVAASRLPSQVKLSGMFWRLLTVCVKVWGVVDLYGMTVKVTIVDRDERDEQNLITRFTEGF